VPLDQAYIVANYLEVDLLHVRAGHKVTIRLDAYRIDLQGTVDSIAPASIDPFTNRSNAALASAMTLGSIRGTTNDDYRTLGRSGPDQKAIHGLPARPDREANCRGRAHASMQRMHRLPMDNLPQGRGISIPPAPSGPTGGCTVTSTLAQAIARHKAAQAAVDAVPDREDCPEHLRDEENEALDELAFTTITVVIAAACHFCPVNA
jgi:hypothetical protein